MVLAMMDDIRVVLIKLADRLHNMRTLKFLSPERQQKIARETQDIYAPIAHRLGMGKIRGELEDLAFQYVDPISYNQVKDAIESRRKEGEAFLAEVQKTIEAQAEGSRHSDAGGSAHQAHLQHLAEAAAAAHLGRPDLRHAGAARHHRSR